MHYYKINNEIMQYSTFGNDIALIMHYRALFTMSDPEQWLIHFFLPGLAYLPECHLGFEIQTEQNIFVDQRICRISNDTVSFLHF